MPKQRTEVPTRRMILNILKKNPGFGVAPIAQKIGLTEMAVRRHLITLEKDGLVYTKQVRQAMGRPLTVYYLTKTADDVFPKNYQKLTLELLGELEDDRFVDELFVRRKNKLIGQYRQRMEGKELAERVIELTAIQNAGGYMAEWSKKENGNYVIEEFNCPISQVANVYNQACECELQLFQSLLQVPVKRTECLAKQGRKCTYIVQSE